LYAKKILELFKKNKTKFGVVVNEYGGTEGVVTLHDLTESIFGDILEEGETEELEIVERADGSLLVEGSMNISDFMDEMNILEYDDLEVEDFTTLGGMAMFFIDASRKRVIHLPIVTYNSRWLTWITGGLINYSLPLINNL
jgi:putative hemolysin